LYRPLIEQRFDPPPFLPRPSGLSQVPLVETSLTSAATIKYAANAFLAMKIGFANEIAQYLRARWGRRHAGVEGLGLDSRIGPKFLSAGIGWGGSCFGQDVQ
jgi:UDPglucose 6-dehydrogenase